jgi:hypothetical protein
MINSNNMNITQEGEAARPFLIITGDWRIQAKAIQREFTNLTDEDLRYESGQERELLLRIQNRLNKKQDEVISIISKVQSRRT